MESTIAKRPWFRAMVLFLAGCFVLVVKWFGGHGNFAFRPHMLEDWVMFGIAAVCFLGSIAIAVKAISKRSA